MKIFYLARFDSSIEDANTRHVFEFCRHFAKVGHTVTLFLPDLGGKRTLPDFRVVYLPVLIRHSGFNFFFYYFQLLLLFPYYYFKFKPDVVYTRHQQMEWITTWLRYVFRFVYIVEVNGLSTVELKIHNKPPWVIFITGLLESFNLRIPHMIVTSSPKIRDVLCRNYRLSREKFLVVSNGADPDVFFPMDKRQCRQKLGLPLEARILIFSGSFKKWHGIGALVQVMPGLIEKDPDVRFLLVGDGEEREAIGKFISQHRLENHILLLGRRPFDEIPQIINCADVCLAPYFDDLLNETGISPIKIFEYMACGKPIISSPLGGLQELFQAHEIGALVGSSDPRDWVQAIEDMLQDPERLRRYGQNARDAVLQEFSWDAICRKISAAIEEIRIAR